MTARTGRRQYPIVDRSLQYRFLALIIVYGAVIVFFLGMCLFVPDILDMMNEDLSLEVRAAAAGRILNLHSRVWPAAIALVCLMGLHSIRTFHRFVGPLSRFRWAFEKISQGDLSLRIQLRKKDYLQREKAAFNEMVDVFKEKWEGMQKASLDALKSMGALEQVVSKPNGWQDADRELLRNQRQQLEALAEQARYFRLKEEKNPGRGS
jgi:methyl-accepting chemotaxis protein